MNASDSSNLVIVERQARQDASRKLEGQGLSVLLSKLFSARGINDISEVRGRMADLEPVDAMKNARAMGALLANCVQDRSRVLIVSDYDCDGATACSVLIEAFHGAKMNSGYMVPDRMKHGYGLTPGIVEEAAGLFPKPAFIVTVDNGISSLDGIERARELGIQVLVTDHHLCKTDDAGAIVLPKARMIVNPQQPGDAFQSKSIAGCGVAWYVASALFDELKKRKMECNFRPADLLPFVAIGTVADVVKLDTNNRILVREGLERIRHGECSYGIHSLAEVSKKNMETMSCKDIGFGLGPRINAAGRLAHMSAGIECLTTRDMDRAATLAKQLHDINEERKTLQKEMGGQADVLVKGVDDFNDKKSIVVFGANWHEGVVGIVAGRLKDNHFRPTFVLTKDKDGEIKGSGRSIPGFHLKHALDTINVQHPGVLVRFGGHAMAAGITIHADQLEAFKDALESVCQQELTPDMLVPRLEHDGALPASAYNEQAIHELGREVWGQGFPQPMFMDSFEVLSSKTMSEGLHLKMVVKKDDFAYDMVAFGDGARIDLLPKRVEVAFQPDLNVYRGRVSVQLMSEALLNVPRPAPALDNVQADEVEPVHDKPMAASFFRRRH